VDLVIESPASTIDMSDLDLAAGIDRSPGIVAGVPGPQILTRFRSTTISQRAIFPARKWPKICTVSATEFADFLRNVGYLEEMGRVFSFLTRSRALSGLTRPPSGSTIYKRFLRIH